VKGGEFGAPLASGVATPPAHDGMAAFSRGRLVRLVRNHELTEAPFYEGPFDPGAAHIYDHAVGGGCTTIEFDPRSGGFGTAWSSLVGTAENCAGGPTPWGSWLSCEETTEGLDAGFEQPHGYVFEVPASADGPVVPEPLRALGRFVHEAVAVDPDGVVYLTEDNGEPADGFYRFLPDRRGQLQAGGRLQMLAVDGHPGYDTVTGQTVGAALNVHWVDIDDPDPAGAEAEPASVFLQGLDKGGARFMGGEGIAWRGGTVYFTASEGGDAELGQVWSYRPRSRDRGTLRLVYESSDAAQLDQPDNLEASPRGGLVLCEDGDGEDVAGGTNFVRGIDGRGRIFPFAENTTPLDLSLLEPDEFPEGTLGTSEFAGARFSPDGQWLFVNIQYLGTTYAITGPWGAGGL
jgi:secreted PhoX family phosphatase